MHVILAVALLIIPLSFFALVFLARTHVRPKNHAYSALATIVAAPILGFCFFGFLAAAEISQGMPFQIGYSVLIALVLAGVTAAWWPPQNTIVRREPMRTPRRVF